MAGLEVPAPKEKPLNVKIVSITACPAVRPDGAMGTIVYGLGDDGRPYAWNSQGKQWMLL